MIPLDMFSTEELGRLLSHIDKIKMVEATPDKARLMVDLHRALRVRMPLVSEREVVELVDEFPAGDRRESCAVPGVPRDPFQALQGVERPEATRAPPRFFASVPRAPARPPPGPGQSAFARMLDSMRDPGGGAPSYERPGERPGGLLLDGLDGDGPLGGLDGDGRLARLERLERLSRAPRPGPRTGVPDDGWMAAREKQFFALCGSDTRDKIRREHALLAESASAECASAEEACSPLRFRVLCSDIALPVKRQIFEKLSAPHGPESTKYIDWLEALLRIPFGKLVAPRVNADAPPSAIREYLDGCSSRMDSVVFGQERFKEEMLSFVASWMRTKDAGHRGALPSAVGICGPVGVGKTTLVKRALAGAVDRPFYFVSLGGASGASTLTGHGFTYEGSTFGAIAAALCSSRCMNPIIFFDELDKVSCSDNGRGEELLNVLVHLTDPAQNATFQDRYFAGVDLDLSQVLLVFSYNDAEKIPPVLRDRIHEVRVKDYSTEDKITIARDFIIPEVCDSLGIARDTFDLKDAALDLLVRACSETSTGLRETKGAIAKILRGVNVTSMTLRNGPSFMRGEGAPVADVELPVVVDEAMVQNVLDERAAAVSRSTSHANIYT